MVKRLAWIGIWTLLMIGCTLVDNPDTPTPMPDPTEESETGIEIDESTPSVSASIDYPDGAKVGGVFRLVAGNGIVPDPAIGDDQTGDDLDSSWLVSEIYSGLTRMAPDQNHAVVPDLAQSFEVDTSGLRYEFMLRQDLKFSDGSPVTASDFKWSWERALSPRTGSPRAFDVLGSIEGAVEIAEGSADELSGVKAVDDRILQVTVSNPRSDFTALLADPVAFVLKRGNVENWGVDWGEVINEFERPIFFFCVRSSRRNRTLQTGASGLSQRSLDFGAERALLGSTAISGQHSYRNRVYYARIRAVDCERGVRFHRRRRGHDLRISRWSGVEDLSRRRTAENQIHSLQCEPAAI